MQRNIKLEVWDENVGFDELVATFLVPFPQDEKDRVKTEPRWANLYGPNIGTSGEKAEYMKHYPEAGKNKKYHNIL